MALRCSFNGWCRSQYHLLPRLYAKCHVGGCVAPTCPNCNKRPRELRVGLNSNGKPRKSPSYRKHCALCRTRPYVAFKQDFCSLCGFIPVNECQLDVDHIDGNHGNNSPNNLQTLCANCHRLKTFLNKDWECQY